MVTEAADCMGCLEGGAHNYRWNDKSKEQVCSKCGHIAQYQPKPNYEELFLKYEELLNKCHELADGETSLNDFRIIISNL